MLVLASSSPTRAKILQEHNINFIQRATDFDENSITYDEPSKFVYYVTLGKYENALKTLKQNEELLVADTIVVSGSKIMGKAADLNHARELLELQSGSSVSIITCMIYQNGKLKLIDLSSADYIFGKFDPKDIEEYLKSKEWEGKAGACMVEGFCEKYIKKVVGLKSCAMGLSIEKLIPFL